MSNEPILLRGVTLKGARLRPQSLTSYKAPHARVHLGLGKVHVLGMSYLHNHNLFVRIISEVKRTALGGVGIRWLDLIKLV